MFVVYNIIKLSIIRTNLSKNNNLFPITIKITCGVEIRLGLKPEGLETKLGEPI